MKKLMIAAAIVCAAAFSQAAIYNWGFSSDQIKGPTAAYEEEGYLVGGYAQLYINGVLIAEAEQDPNNYNFGSFDNTANDTKGKVQSLDRGDISDTFEGQAYKLVLRTDDDQYEIVINGISSYDNVQAGAGEPDYNYERFITTTAFQAKDWTEVVPEPTSGLLLLIGMAGLALRRRRA